MSPRSDPWWTSAFASLRPNIERFLARRLPSANVQDVLSTVMEQLVKKSKTFSTTHPAWLSVSEEPSPGQAAEFVALAWKIARMRMLDELRHVYVTKKAHARVRSQEPGIDLTAQVDARQVLGLLARHLDELSDEERELLLSAVDRESTDNGALSAADRVKLHRLRRRLAEKLWTELNPSKKEGKDGA